MRRARWQLCHVAMFIGDPTRLSQDVKLAIGRNLTLARSDLGTYRVWGPPQVAYLGLLIREPGEQPSQILVLKFEANRQ